MPWWGWLLVSLLGTTTVGLSWATFVLLQCFKYMMAEPF